jgi:antitoxin VapB
MALNIKNAEVERLASEVARLAHESKTEAIRRALQERYSRLQVRQVERPRRERLQALLKSRIWPAVSPDVLGRAISKDEEERILGYGPDGV